MLFAKKGITYINIASSKQSIPKVGAASNFALIIRVYRYNLNGTKNISSWDPV